MTNAIVANPRNPTRFATQNCGFYLNQNTQEYISAFYKKRLFNVYSHAKFVLSNVGPTPGNLNHIYNSTPGNLVSAKIYTAVTKQFALLRHPLFGSQP